MLTWEYWRSRNNCWYTYLHSVYPANQSEGRHTGHPLWATVGHAAGHNSSDQSSAPLIYFQDHKGGKCLVAPGEKEVLGYAFLVEGTFSQAGEARDFRSWWGSCKWVGWAEAEEWLAGEGGEWTRKGKEWGSSCGNPRIWVYEPFALLIGHWIVWQLGMCPVHHPKG